MGDLEFACVGVRADAYSAAPTLQFRLTVDDPSGEPVQALALRCQFRIEPARRTYTEREEVGLVDLFGEPERWGESLKPLTFGFTSYVAQGFRGHTEFDLPMSCTYDHEVAATKYFDALDDGEIPLLLLFSGTVFRPGTSGFQVAPIAWDAETRYRLPVPVWRQLIDLHFPGSGWIRLRRDTLGELRAFRSQRALLSWDETFETLLRAGRE